MKKIILREIEYELIENNQNCFNEEQIREKVTDYFDSYDYILGDYAYGKLRLKGFYDSENPKCNRVNNIQDKGKYLKTQCAYHCKYFLLKKTK